MDVEGGLQFAVNNLKMKLIKARIVVLRTSQGTFQGAGRGDHKLTTPNFCPLSNMLASFPGPAQLFVACSTRRAWERGYIQSPPYNAVMSGYTTMVGRHHYSWRRNLTTAHA